MTRQGSQEAVQVYAHEDADAPGIRDILESSSPCKC